MFQTPFSKLNIAKEERLAKYDKSDKVISSHEYRDKLKEEKERHNFKSLISKLDELTEGFETGELIVISGYTGHGKTSLCQTLTFNFKEQDIKSLWFSYEMPARQFFAKFPGELPLFYLPANLKGSELSWIEDRMIEAKIKFEVRVIFIDHLHFLIDLARSSHPSLEIGTIVRALKSLAMKHNLVIFLVAHTSMPKGARPVGLEDVRDSSFITQESDSTMAIQRIKRRSSALYGNDAWLTILKHRRMGTMGRRVKLIYRDKQFYEIDEKENE